jgi:sorbose reductase
MPLTISTDPFKQVLLHFSLKGKVVAATGGVRGISLEFVRAIAEAGAPVALTYTSSTHATQMAEAISRATG